MTPHPSSPQPPKNCMTGNDYGSDSFMSCFPSSTNKRDYIEYHIVISFWLFLYPSLWFTGSSLLSISTVCPVLGYLLFIFYHSLSPLIWPDIFVMIVDWELLEKLMLKLRKHVHAIGLQGQCLLQKPMLSCKPILMYVW